MICFAVVCFGSHHVTAGQNAHCTGQSITITNTNKHHHQNVLLARNLDRVYYWMTLQCKALCPISSSKWKRHLCHLHHLHHDRCWKLVGEQLKSTSKITIWWFSIFFWQKFEQSLWHLDDTSLQGVVPHFQQPFLSVALFVPSPPFATWQMFKTGWRTIKIHNKIILSRPGCPSCFCFIPVAVLVPVLVGSCPCSLSYFFFGFCCPPLR